MSTVLDNDANPPQEVHELAIDNHDSDDLEMTEQRSTEQELPAIERTSLLETAPRNPAGASYTYRNFILFALLFSAVPASALACLGLATARLGAIGAWQSSALYLSYTVTAILASPVIVQKLGSRNGVVLGQALFGSYVACFWLALVVGKDSQAWALSGAFLGGAGSSIMWTAQGVYFTQAAESFSLESGTEWSESTSLFAGIFAFCLLAEETLMDLLSTFLVRVGGVPWSFVFALYASAAIVATAGTMVFIKPYPQDEGNEDENTTWLGKASAALWLVARDSKVKYFVFFNSAFAFAGAYLNSFVSGEVIPVALKDSQSSFVGVFVAIHGGSAAIFSLVFGKVSQRFGKGPVLVVGCFAFASVSLPFLFQPDFQLWTWKVLVLIYILEGIGRSTFEGALKGMFADYFPYQKEAAFANIIVQNGLSSVIAYALSVRLPCTPDSSPYCIKYRDEHFRQVGVFSAILVGTSLLAVGGYLRASFLNASGAHSEYLQSYRRRSVDTYRRVSAMSRSERRTYATLNTAIEEASRQLQAENLPDIT